MDPAVEEYLSALTGRLDDAFASALMAVILTGSLALDAFDPDTSDVDVAVVVRDGVGRPVRTAALERVRHRALPCPARGLELVAYPEAFAASGEPGAGFVLELNDGPTMPFRAHLDPRERPESEGDFWYVIDRAITRARGETLLGPAPSQVFGAPADAEVLGALRRSVAWHRGADAGRNAVLNACRAVRWTVDRTWLSKPAAGRWWLSRRDEPIVAAALADARLSPPAVEDFLTRAETQLTTP